MSHAATNWAIKQRGLKPATKIVLWYLADCHNGHTGQCNPKQSTLADLCEMSRSTLNLHLDKLEELGLIKRITRVDDQSKRQSPTCYVLAFDDPEKPVSENRTQTQDADDGHTTSCVSMSENRTRDMSENRTEPCPNFGHSRVLKSDTYIRKNPGKEPGSLAAREASPVQDDGIRLRCLVVEALGLTGTELNTSGTFIVGGMTPGEVGMHFAAWRTLGLADDQIVGAIAAKVSAMGAIDQAWRPRSLKFFDGPVRDFADRLTAKPKSATGQRDQQTERDRRMAFYRRVAGASE